MVRRIRRVVESRQVERARKKFLEWRQSRNGLWRIPDELWESAVHDEKSMSIKRLLNLLFGSVSSEKTTKLLGKLQAAARRISKAKRLTTQTKSRTRRTN